MKPLPEWFNASSPRVKSGAIKPGELTPDRALAMMIADPLLIRAAVSFGAGRWSVIRKVIVPSAMSWVFAGLKISVPYALIGAVLGEMIAANRGLGYLVQFSGSQFDSAGVFAVLIVIALLAVALNFLVEIVQHRMQRWRRFRRR